MYIGTTCSNRFDNIPGYSQRTCPEIVVSVEAWWRPYWIALCSYLETVRLGSKRCSSGDSVPCCSWCLGCGNYRRGGCWRGRCFSSCCYRKGWQGTETWPTVSPVYGIWPDGFETTPEIYEDENVKTNKQTKHAIIEATHMYGQADTACQSWTFLMAYRNPKCFQTFWLLEGNVINAM